MMLQQVDVCCPSCSGFLHHHPERWNCQSCGRSFPVIFGIPDLRIFSDPYLDMETDRVKGMDIAKQFDTSSFEDLVRYYYKTTSVVPRHHADQYTRSLLNAKVRTDNTLQDWKPAKGGAFLEIGCGTAPLLASACGIFNKVVGVDIAFRWLVIAKKRLQEAGLDVPLICACAESLPLRANQFSAVAFDSTLEVVQDQNKALRETRRVMQPGGELFVLTPNRYSLGPDPHLKIWAGGYLPERWIAAYARRQQAIPPKRKLLTAGSLRKLLVESGFGSVKICVSSILSHQLPRFLRTVVSSYNVARKIPVARLLLNAIGPLIQGTGRKSEG